MITTSEEHTMKENKNVDEALSILKETLDNIEDKNLTDLVEERLKRQRQEKRENPFVQKKKK